VSNGLAHLTFHQATNYAPAILGLVGPKFFLIKNFGISAEWKRTTA